MVNYRFGGKKLDLFLTKLSIRRVLFFYLFFFKVSPINLSLNTSLALALALAVTPRGVLALCLRS